MQERDATKVAAWIHQVWEGIEQAPEQFDWINLAEWGKNFALPTGKPPDIQWAHVVMDIYTYLMEQANADKRSSIALYILGFKASLIGRLGNVKGDPLLDAEQLVNFFFAWVKISPSEAMDQSVEWKKFMKLDRVSREALLQQSSNRDGLLENARSLRRIKNMLNQLHYLVDKQLLEPTEELCVWLSLRLELP